MTLCFLLAAAMLTMDESAPVDADSTWALDTRHSQIQFQVPRLGFSTVTGRFDAFEMDVELDRSDLSSLRVSATVDVASVNTGIERRDNHLRSADFFNAETHPTIEFASTDVVLTGDESLDITGELTLRGVTRTVTFHAVLLGSTVWNDKLRMAFSAEATIDRLDFGVSWSRVTDRGGIIIGNDVTIILSIEIGEREAESE